MRVHTVLSLLLVFSSCVKVIDTRSPAKTTLFVDKRVSNRELWLAVKSVTEESFHFKLKFTDLEHGNVTTEFRSIDSLKPLRSQLFLTIRPTSSGNFISVFQFLQTWDAIKKSWKPLASDQKLENQFIVNLGEKLHLEKTR